MKFATNLGRFPSKICFIPRVNIRDKFLSSTNRCMSSQSPPIKPKQIFSGIQPTGVLHLGNYYGAVQQWVDLQNAGHECIFSIVDMHAITDCKDGSLLNLHILEMAAVLLACGIDPEKCILYQQSKVKQHAELMWILICLINVARLTQQPQFKEKTSCRKEIPLGLLIYPVLQAADILLYKTTHVPAGEDQSAHLNLTSEIVNKFNQTYGNTFPNPAIMLTDACRLKSLRDPTKKMSKSEFDSKSYITLLDSDSDIVKKCKKAVTDCTSAVTFDPDERPGVSNLIFIHSRITGKSPKEICEEAQGLQTGQYKMVVADALVEWIRPIRSRAVQFLSDPLYIIDTLNNGAYKASDIAECTMLEVREKVGLTLRSDGIPGNELLNKTNWN